MPLTMASYMHIADMQRLGRPPATLGRWPGMGRRTVVGEKKGNGADILIEI